MSKVPIIQPDQSYTFADLQNLKDQLYALTVVGKFCLSQAVYDEALKKVGEYS